MHENVRALINTILKGIMIDEQFAQALAELAHQCRLDGNDGFAREFQALGRHHRVKGMEGRARIAVLSAQYAPSLNSSGVPNSI